MQVDDSCQSMLAVHHDQGGNTVLFHEAHSRRGQFIRTDRFRVPAGEVGSGDARKIAAVLDESSQISVRDDPHQ